jgi:hypothetical protein
MIAGRVVIERYIAEDGDLVDIVSAETPEGEPLGLAEALGMMRLAEDTLIRDRMGNTQ